MFKHWSYALKAFGLICVYLVLVLSPLFILLLGEVPSGSGFWWDFSMALGFTAMAMMGVQFLLTARFRHVSAPFGIDIIYYFHRYLAILAVGFIFLHYLIVKVNSPDALGDLNPLQAPIYMTAGRFALLLFVLMIFSSVWRKQLHFHYDQWRLVHIILAVSAFLLALGHIEGVGYYIDAPAKQILWSTYTLFWVVLIVYIRVIKPWMMKSRPYRVIEVKEEKGNSHTLVLAAKNKQQIIQFKPGQFAWLSLKTSPWNIKEHPFSISSSAQNNQQLEFTIKALGDFTRKIKHTQIGDLAYVDGPYGIFTIDQYTDAEGYVFIAGGVGAAPIISMLRTLADRHDQRPLVFIYANNNWEDVIFREELEQLEKRLNLQLVHVIKAPEKNWHGESGFITEALLSKTLTQNAYQYECFICGPKQMSDSVQQSLYRLKIPLSQIHFELFDVV